MPLASPMKNVAHTSVPLVAASECRALVAVGLATLGSTSLRSPAYHPASIPGFCLITIPGCSLMAVVASAFGRSGQWAPRRSEKGRKAPSQKHRNAFQPMLCRRQKQVRSNESMNERGKWQKATRRTSGRIHRIQPDRLSRWGHIKSPKPEKGTCEFKPPTRSICRYYQNVRKEGSRRHERQLIKE